MKNLVLLSCLLFFFSCQEENAPAPIPVPTCSISTETGVNNAYKLEYLYDAAGFISTLNVSVGSNGQLKPAATIKYTYENGLLVKLVDADVEEKLEYNSSGILTRLVITKTNDAAFVNYTLNYEMDAEKRVVKVTDSKGLQTTIKRDAQGNIVETVTVNISTGKEMHKVVLSDYDNKKSLNDSFKSWQISVLGYYGDYIKFPLFTKGASGNFKKRIDYIDGKPSTEVTFTYTYNTNGFPITEQSLTKFLDGSGIATYSKTFGYTACQQ
ncbi:MAG: hypothetical protein EAZ70_09075 [Runella slithyformis]|nr:MAG: hypothetical protein EAY79_09915 [Runella slithyformis]TAF26162.1 MAG: hypothetical protein EAZ70_09075 [Runella slithyformis]TAF47506.1 MAG: hypothetical protein EAZ63_07785 [Runella slithyformis]TAF80354.1 MAG: hypothetical protein EAZ50_09065 [Runella slithyformis]